MLPPIDAVVGETYLFKVRNESFTATYLKSKSGGEVVFERTDKGGRWHVSRKDYIFMRCRGIITRVMPQQAAEDRHPVEPGAFEPIEPGDSKKVRARKKAYLKATIQQYYVMCMDEYGVSASHKPLAAFIEEHQATHTMLFGEGTKAPGTSTLIMLARECGEKHCRPFVLFLNGSGGDRKSSLWCDFVRVLKQAMIEWYWSPDRPTPRAVKAWFKGAVANERNRRLALEVGDAAGDEMRGIIDNAVPGPPPSMWNTEGSGDAIAEFLAAEPKLDAGFAKPCDTTLQNWIDREATLANIARREGRTVANRQMEGVHPHVTALRPLECVVMDHTQIDMHVVVYDDTGKIVSETYRPWLIVVLDVHTRMVLAARLSMEGPSLYTLNSGLRDCLGPKEFLQEHNRGPAYAWSLDGFGKFKRMLVDNDLANIGRSMRAAAASVGLIVSFAPVKTPTYKALVERFFKTLNLSLWHEADGGVPEKPGVSDRDPRKNARFTLMEAQRLLWKWIITDYHLDVHDELGVPPALKWRDSFEGREAFETYTRPLVDDFNLIDNAFGRRAKRTFTSSGVEYRKEVFSDPDLNTMFLDDLCHLSRNPRGTKKKNNTRSVEIELTEHPTREKIGIYNPARGTYFEFPNENSTHVGSYEDGVEERAETNRRIEKFFSRNDLDVNKAEIAASLREVQPPTIDPATLAGAFNGVMASAAMLADGRSSAHGAPIHKTDQVVVQRTGSRRGGKAATAKAVRTRANKRKALELKTKAAPLEQDMVPDPFDAAQNLKTLDIGGFSVTDNRAFLELMKAELKLSRE